MLCKQEEMRFEKGEWMEKMKIIVSLFLNRFHSSFAVNSIGLWSRVFELKLNSFDIPLIGLH